MVSQFESSSQRSPRPDGFPTGPSRESSMASIWAEECPWEGDPDMDVKESFDAKFELTQFTDFVMPESTKDEHYLRLLVLMEFHHKIRFIIQYLKSFEYLLIQKWPETSNATELYHLLALDCIKPLLRLFKSLGVRIDACRTTSTYGNFAEEVLNWMEENNNENLVEWLVLCSRLCSSNCLDDVKAAVNLYRRRHIELVEVLNVRYKKFRKVDTLAQTRTLLFSLPMIAGNVRRTLSKKTTSYTDEADIWEKILKHCDSLPQYINSKCMPLIDLANSGQIVNQLEKKELISLPELVQFQNFPNTMFQNTLLTQNKARLEILQVHTNSYVKEPVDVLAILYKEALILLPIDSDNKYSLKPLKSPKSSTDKHFPIILLPSERFIEDDIKKTGAGFKYSKPFHITTATERDNGFQLTLLTLNIDPLIMVKLKFTKCEIRDEWAEILGVFASPPPYHVEIKVLKILSTRKTVEPPQDPVTTDIGEVNDDVIDKGDVSLVPQKITSLEDEDIAKTVEKLKDYFCSSLHIDPDDYRSLSDMIITEGSRDSKDFLLALSRPLFSNLELMMTCASQSSQSQSRCLDKSQMANIVRNSRMQLKAIDQFKKTLLDTDSLTDEIDQEEEEKHENEARPVSLRVQSTPFIEIDEPELTLEENISSNSISEVDEEDDKSESTLGDDHDHATSLNPDSNPSAEGNVMTTILSEDDETEDDLDNPDLSVVDDAEKSRLSLFVENYVREIIQSAQAKCRQDARQLESSASADENDCSANGVPSEATDLLQA